MNAETHPTEELPAYWLDELDESRANEIEEHVFDCDVCAARLRELIVTGGAMRKALLKGTFATVVTPPFIRRLLEGGARIREYHLDPGASVNCTVAPEDDLVVSHLRVAADGVRQIDLVVDDEHGGLLHRARHVPFDATTGEVTVIPPVALVRTMGTTRQRMRLLSVEHFTERLLGEYTFNHAPHDPRA